jgi:hypothetical protein
MKRFALSVICGFVAPFLYSVIVALLTGYLKSPVLTQLLGIPIKWPLLIYSRLFYLPFPILLLYVAACNVLFYGILSYCVLWMLSKRREARYPFPPPPTDFTM